MSKFKEGDRVAFYGGFGRLTGTVSNAELDCVGMFTVIGEGGTKFNVHPKQCRKLKKKERRRVWIWRGVERSNTYEFRINPPTERSDEWSEFVEVRRK